MQRVYLSIGVVSVLASGWTQATMADDGLIRVTWPSPENPGPPFCARIEPTPPYVFSDGEWVGT